MRDYIPAVADCPVHMVRGNNDFFSDLPGRRKNSFVGGGFVFWGGCGGGGGWEKKSWVLEGGEAGVCVMVGLRRVEFRGVK